VETGGAGGRKGRPYTRVAVHRRPR